MAHRIHKPHVPGAPRPGRLPGQPSQGVLPGRQVRPGHPPGFYGPDYSRVRPERRITFAGLGKFDWAGAIGTAASVYTGQPNALNNPAAAAAAAMRPAPVVQEYGPPSPARMTVEARPWFKSPIVLGVAGAAVLGLSYMLFRSIRSRRR